MKFSYGLVLSLALVASAACASSGAGTRPRTTYDRNQLTRAELATRPADNMHAVVQAMRPNWLITPMGGAGISNTSATNPVSVWVDGQLYGGAEMLKSLGSDVVESARYYTATEAQNKYGMRASSPIIDLVTRRPGS